MMMHATARVAAAALICASLAAAPVAAQFGGLIKPPSIPSTAPKKDSSGNGGCPKGKKGSSVGRSILGSAIGDVTSRAAGKAGVMGSYVPTAEVSGILTDAIACRLDPEEQKQAADATERATRGEEVGSTAAWTSETRPGVSGTSTVVARNDDAGGRRCMNVTDFVIVDGQETKVTKKMCKEPGQKRYMIAEA
jgi:surface antigen